MFTHQNRPPQRARVHALLCAGAALFTGAHASASQLHAKNNHGVCLDVAGGSSANGTPVQVAACSSNTAQNWTLVNDTVRVMGNKCLDVPNANTSAGTRLQIWDCNGLPNQTFRVSGKTLVWTPARMCVDIPSGQASNGALVQTWSCNGTGAQSWEISGTPSSSTGSTPPANSGNWKLVWADEFNGNALDRSKWNVEVNCDGGGNNEQECYVDSPSNISVGNGVLSLNVIKQYYNGKPYTSGRINTSGKASWTYGRFETRLKVPCGQGLWPAAWMLPEPNGYGAWPTSGELDIMEILGGKANTLYGTAHFGRPWPDHHQLGGSATSSSANYCGDFHVFAIEWAPTVVTWYVDGRAYFSMKNTDAAWAPLSHWPFDKPFFFILNLAMGGEWPGAPDGNIQRATLEVDYVRAYSR